MILYFSVYIIYVCIYMYIYVMDMLCLVSKYTSPNRFAAVIRLGYGYVIPSVTCRVHVVYVRLRYFWYTVWYARG